MSADLALRGRDARFSRVAYTEEAENEDDEASLSEWKVRAQSVGCV